MLYMNQNESISIFKYYFTPAYSVRVNVNEFCGKIATILRSFLAHDNGGSRFLTVKIEAKHVSE